MITQNHNLTSTINMSVKRAFTSIKYSALFLLMLVLVAPVAVAQRPGESTRAEFALHRVADNRVAAADTSKLPFSAIVKLKVTFPDGATGWGTGAMIGPDKVITAEHVVFSLRHGGHAEAEVLPGYSNGATVCHTTRVKSMSHGEHQGCHEGANCDVAILVLEDRIGCNTGWFGLKKFSEADLSDVYIAGYPSDRDEGEQLYFVRTSVSRSEGERHNILEYSEWTAGGMSGGPIFTPDYYIVGIHTTGGQEANYGIGICDQLRQTLIRWAGL